MTGGESVRPEGLSVVIPTLGRGVELIGTIRGMVGGSRPPDEILVVDQTPRHAPATAAALSDLDRSGAIRWLRLARASIPHAMNVGLVSARNPIVLFVDDDVNPDSRLVETHLRAHQGEGCEVVGGQVLQPGEEPDGSAGPFRFNSTRRGWITDLIACNFSVRRDVALEIGGFDENFVRVAYRFETEFAERLGAAGRRIVFEPRASLRHLKVARGGTRTYGHHLRTARPAHSVGAYYYLLRSSSDGPRPGRILNRFLGSIRTRHHLRRPWWIVPTLVAEALGFVWACTLVLRGPRLIDAARAAEWRHP
ncbi:MAG TPA: glycosyltransferase [Longimicrobiales bacterium]|nr:glycosyltransferase [Longimicrobiales bacterium]